MQCTLHWFTWGISLTSRDVIWSPRIVVNIHGGFQLNNFLIEYLYTVSDVFFIQYWFHETVTCITMMELFPSIYVSRRSVFLACARCTLSSTMFVPSCHPRSLLCSSGVLYCYLVVGLWLPLVYSQLQARSHPGLAVFTRSLTPLMPRTISRSLLRFPNINLQHGLHSILTCKYWCSCSQLACTTASLV